MIKESDEKISAEDALAYCMELGLANKLDLAASKKKHLEVPVVLMPDRWEAYDNFLNINKDEWTELKYFDDQGNRNSELSTIPNDSGGIYIYYIKPTVLPLNNETVIMYVGRAHFGEKTQNLRKRVYHYEQEAKDDCKGRIAIRQLFNIYKKYLYVMYKTIDGNDNIDKIEKELVAAIVPPCNSDLFQKSLKESKNMF